MFLAIGVVLGLMVFGVSRQADWHWGVGLCLAAIPIAFTYFLGVFGVVIAAIFVGSMYKASG